MRTLIVGPSRAAHPDALVYQRTARAFRERDLDTIADTIHEFVVWHFPGKSWLARTVQGRGALLAFLQEIFTRTGKTFVLEDRHISGTEHHVVALQWFGATKGGETKKFETTSILRFENGQQIERWFHIPDQDAFDAFFMRFE